MLDLALAGRGVLEGELASASGRLFRKQARLNEPGYPNPDPNPNPNPNRRDSMNHCLQKQPSSPHLPLPDYVDSAAVLDEIRAGARRTYHPYPPYHTHYACHCYHCCQVFHSCHSRHSGYSYHPHRYLC